MKAWMLSAVSGLLFCYASAASAGLLILWLKWSVQGRPESMLALLFAVVWASLAWARL